MAYILIITIIIFGSCIKEKPKETPKPPLQKSNYKIIYYKTWDSKSNKPIGIILNIKKRKYNKYVEVTYNNKNQIVNVKKINNNKIIIYHYNNKNQLNKKITKLTNTTIIDNIHPLGYILERTKYSKNNNLKLSREQFNPKGQKIKVEKYDNKEKLKLYKTIEYFKNSNIIAIEKTFNKDIKLYGTDEYNKKIYLHKTRYYNPDGKLNKEEFYDREENKIGHWKKYQYTKNQISVKIYNKNNKLKETFIYNKKGKLIKIRYED